jgi:hypothetical protein
MDNRQRSTQPQVTHDTESKPKREGDVLGLSDANPAVPLPGPPVERGTPSRSREADPDPTRHNSLPRTSGATGIDMGAGGTGTSVEPASSRRPEPTE